MSRKHFIIGGAQRSATSFLVQALDAHEQISFAQPLRPEPKFFIKPDEYAKGYQAYLETYFLQNTVSETAVLGEKSTSYIEHPAAARQIKETLANVKLIFLLRNPIERAISNINFSRMHGYETAPLDVAILRELDAPEDVLSQSQTSVSVSPQAYLKRSSYVDQLQYWFELFDHSQILVLQTEQVTTNTAYLERVFSFLEVQHDNFSSSSNIVINASDKPDGNTLSKPTLSRLKEHFAPKNAALAKLCDLDLTAWS